MANFIYDNARKMMLDGALDWVNDDIRCWLVNTSSYTANASSDVYASAVGAGARIAGGSTGLALGNSGNRTTTGGAADGPDLTFTSVSGNAVGAFVIFKLVAADLAQSPLLLYIDQATGLPITPNSGDIILAWDNGTNKIFRP
jgi:hypothetical protein